MPTDQLVTVHRGRGLRALGIRRDNVVAYDFGFHWQGGDYHQRAFVLLDERMQINQPVIFPPEQRGWWYCDLVEIAVDGDDVHVDDKWIDVIIGPPDHPYRLLDLHDYADAIEDGRLRLAEAVEGLRRMQAFLDRRLNRRHDVTRTWPEFPPPEVEALMAVELPQQWEHLPEG
jgi:hypothetical protein